MLRMPTARAARTARGLHHSPGCDDAAETVYVSQLKRQRVYVASLVNVAFY